MVAPTTILLRAEQVRALRPPITIVNAKDDRVVFGAPGLRATVAKALAAAIQRLAGRVTIVLDIDGEVCRLGYSDVEGLELIQAAAAESGVLVLH